MSGTNTKESKVNRILARVSELQTGVDDVIVDLLRRQASDHAMMQMLTAMCAQLEADNSRLRKYLGSELFVRRQRDVLMRRNHVTR